MSITEREIQIVNARRRWLYANRRMWRILKSQTISTETWWKARCRQLSPPTIPPTLAESRGKFRDVDTIIRRLFADHITEQINRPCLLLSLLPHAPEGKRIKWDDAETVK